MPPLRRTAAIVLAMLSILVFAAPVAAKPGGGNSAGAAACENGGYLNWTRADGTTFKNEGACTNDTAKGGVLKPANPFSITYAAESANPGFYRWTLVGNGLEPNSLVDLRTTYANGAESSRIASVLNTGSFDNEGRLEPCAVVGAPVQSVRAIGTPAGGFETTFQLLLPGPTVCP